MKTAVTLSMSAVVFLLLSSVIVAQPGGGFDGGGGPGGFGPGRGFVFPMPTLNTNRRVVSPAAPVWIIPAGQYGLQLKNGTRIIGQPAKGWSATLKTSFGTVTIPLAQITRLEPAGNGQYSAFLKNGDRVTGQLVSKVLSFETQFGSLMVPTPDLVRLSSATAKSSPVPNARNRDSNTDTYQTRNDAFR